MDTFGFGQWDDDILNDEEFFIVAKWTDGTWRRELPYKFATLEQATNVADQVGGDVVRVSVTYHP
jgi:hypothetical protein